MNHVRLELLARRLTLAATIGFVALLVVRMQLDLAAPSLAGRLDAWAPAAWVGAVGFWTVVATALAWLGTLGLLAAASTAAPRPDHGAGVADAG